MGKKKKHDITVVHSIGEWKPGDETAIEDPKEIGSVDINKKTGTIRAKFIVNERGADYMNLLMPDDKYSMFEELLTDIVHEYHTGKEIKVEIRVVK